MNLIPTQSPPGPCYLFSFNPKYLLKHPQPMFFPVCWNFSAVLINLSDAVNIVQPKSTYKTNLTGTEIYRVRQKKVYTL
jgi:hypothetical protein